jgi:hypothetical protein
LERRRPGLLGSAEVGDSGAWWRRRARAELLRVDLDPRAGGGDGIGLGSGAAPSALLGLCWAELISLTIPFLFNSFFKIILQFVLCKYQYLC